MLLGGTCMRSVSMMTPPLSSGPVNTTRVC